MNILPGLGRIVFFGQWLCAVLLPIWALFATEWLGAESMGMGFLVALMLTPLIAAGMLVPAALTLFDKEVRSLMATRGWYSAGVIVLWSLFAAYPFFSGFGEYGRSGYVPRITEWTAGAFSVDAAIEMQYLIAYGVLAVWAVVSAFATAGIIIGRRSRPA
ncbi:MAG: hypothetical protein JST33_15905 [Actinobacteria bacterium]|nr:hypothetical protein [Actinomycetota bacterium]